MREIMTDAEIGLAEAVADAKANGTQTSRRGGPVRYDRPWNRPTATPGDAPHVPDNADAVARLTRQGGPAAAPTFIVARPRGDRYVMSLLDDLAKLDNDAAAAGRAWYDRNRATLTIAQGWDWIDRLKAKIAALRAMPTAVDAEAAWTEWHALAGELAALGGRYGARFAVDTEPNAVNKIAFWWISPGRVPGRFFLRQVIGGLGPVRVRMSVGAMIGVARKIIAVGADDALRRYGRELGECGHCGRELTNDESRALGIGPVCRAR